MTMQYDMKIQRIVNVCGKHKSKAYLNNFDPFSDTQSFSWRPLHFLMQLASQFYMHEEQ